MASLGSQAGHDPAPCPQQQSLQLKIAKANPLIMAALQQTMRPDGSMPCPIQYLITQAQTALRDCNTTLSVTFEDVARPGTHTAPQPPIAVGDSWSVLIGYNGEEVQAFVVVLGFQSVHNKAKCALVAYHWSEDDMKRDQQQLERMKNLGIEQGRNDLPFVQIEGREPMALGQFFTASPLFWGL
jgi:hypothetical protein